MKDIKKNSYSDDINFLKSKKNDIIELKDSSGKAKVLIVPSYQGRVMTSTANGNNGMSFGWINYDLISENSWNKKFNPVGGEERFWLGPEGGPFSFYFEKDKEQIFENWNVPSVIDREPFDLISHSESEAVFRKTVSLSNASGYIFDLDINRTVSIIEKSNLEKMLHYSIPDALNIVAFTSKNSITNVGKSSWNKTTGLPSIWMLCMFKPSKAATVVAPFKSDNNESKIINDDYFGKIPSDRLIIEDSLAYFKVDGTLRSKLGIPYNRAKNLIGSYDSESSILTILIFNLPTESTDYVNSKWGKQDNPFTGDVVNSYNDGPTEDGSIMGPFYEIETSSPGAVLNPGQSVLHEQTLVHIQGNKKDLNSVCINIFGVSLNDIIVKFNK